MARKQIGTVSFSITGEFITDHCRERVLSGDWRGALAVLEEVEGFGMENSIKLLKGEVELYGDSSTEKGVLLRETNSTDKEILKYLKSFNFLYAGLYNFNNTVFKPEYHVKAFNAEDIETAIEIYGEDSDTSAFFRARSMHYAPNSTYLATGPVTKQDKINGNYDSKLVSKKALLWKPVADYPIWITPHKNIEDALADYDKHCKLSKLQTTGAEFPEQEEAKKPEKTESASTPAKKLYTRENYDAENKAREEKHNIMIQKIRDEIIGKLGEKGGEDWLRMPVYKKEESSYTKGAIPELYINVPRLAFLHWALKNIPAVKLGIIEEWTPVSRSGLKMYNDDRFHSDWVIAAGYDPEVFYEKHDDINTAAYAFAMTAVRNMTDFDLMVLSKSSKKRFSGRIKHLKPGEVLEEGQVGVISHAGVEFDSALRSAAKHKTGLICLTGGQMAHIVVVGREIDVPIVMWDKAEELWGCHHVYVDTEKGTIHISPS